MNNIYVVMGGIYQPDDTNEEWAVIAYHSAAAAQARVMTATKRANELRQQYLDQIIPAGANEFDPEMKSGKYEVAYYWVMPVKLHPD